MVQTLHCAGTMAITHDGRVMAPEKQMSAVMAHNLLRHSSMEATWLTGKHLMWMLAEGTAEICKVFAAGKAN